MFPWSIEECWFDSFSDYNDDMAAAVTDFFLGILDQQKSICACIGMVLRDLTTQSFWFFVYPHNMSDCGSAYLAPCPIIPPVTGERRPSGHPNLSRERQGQDKWDVRMAWAANRYVWDPCHLNPIPTEFILI